MYHRFASIRQAYLMSNTNALCGYLIQLIHKTRLIPLAVIKMERYRKIQQQCFKQILTQEEKNSYLPGIKENN